MSNESEKNAEGTGDLPLAKGLGQPLFTSYIYPYSKDTTGMSGGAGGTKTGLGAGLDTPLFVVHTYPYTPPDAEVTKPEGSPTPGG
jgi:hypothetical protein